MLYIYPEPDTDALSNLADTDDSSTEVSKAWTTRKSKEVHTTTCCRGCDR